MRRLFSSLSPVALLMMFAGLSLPACSSSDDVGSRLYVDVSLAPGTSAPAAVHFDIQQAQSSLAQADFNWKADQAVLKVGLPIPKGATGTVVVKASGRDAAGVEVANGASAESPIGSQAIAVVLTAVPVAGADAGVDTSGSDAGPSDAVTDAAMDGRTTDAAALDQAVLGDALGNDGLALDGGLEDASAVDSPVSDAPVDGTSPQVDTNLAADTYVSPDAGGEAGTILTALKSCKQYVHYPNSPATCADGSNQYDVYVNTTLFTPDGKYLVSAANNSWVKLWKVVEGGLEDTTVVFVGASFYVTAAISPAGDVLALANQSGDIVLYDLKAAISSGTVTALGTLSTSKLTEKSVGGNGTRAFFTTDGKQLVATYTSSASWEKAMIVVWDPATQLPVREIGRDWKDSPKAVYPAPTSGPLWVASALSQDVDTDGGSIKQTTVTLEDVSFTGGGKPSFIVPGEVNRITFSADARTLAIGTVEGEVGLWDISVKSNIQRLGHPLIEATTSGSSDSVYALAFSRDGAYLAVGSWIYRGPSFLRVVTLQTGTITQREYQFEPDTFGFAPDGTTWAFGLGGCGFFNYCKN